MKVVILAGGLGTRLGVITNVIPKPMIKVGKYPMIWHIVKYYLSFGHKDFIIALGYKSDIIKKYFLKIAKKNISSNIKKNKSFLEIKNIFQKNCKITLVDTGLESMTGGRLKRISKFLKNESFMLTYGDGLSNIDINKLIKFHNSHKKIATISAVHPIARFGELKIKGKNVISFKEKPQTVDGWINGGFFVFESDVLNRLESDHTVLESYPLESLSKEGQLKAYKHDGFWYCMDTPRDKDHLNMIWKLNNAPWKIWKK